MPEVDHASLSAYLEKTGRTAMPCAILIYGEEMLCQKALGEVLNLLAPDRQRSGEYEPMDGALADMGEVLERVNTYALLGGGKTVGLMDARLFHARADAGKLLEKARSAYQRDEMKKAAGLFLSLMALHQLDFDDLESPQGRKKLTGSEDGDSDWMPALVAHCRSRNLAVPSGGSDAERLAQALEKGFAPGNYLVITSEVADKRRKLFGLLKEEGLVVNCAVPRGDRRADREAQNALLREQAREQLAGSGKRLGPGAFDAIVDLTGFDLRTFSGNLEKLVAYAGDRDEIGVADVSAVLQRTRKDPIYELTNAVADRQAVAALTCLDALLADNFHPLQVLAALTNQIRRLLLAKGFVESDAGRVWQPGIPYGRFAAQVMPAVVDADAALVEAIGSWERRLAPEAEAKGRGKKKTAKAKTDLVLARNPKSAFPVYQTLKKSDGFSLAELVRALGALGDGDRRLKLSGQGGRVVLERLILGICLRGEGEAEPNRRHR